MKTHLLTSLRMIVVMTLLTGALYPGLMTLLMQVIFPKSANGSTLTRDGKTVGSELIGQSFHSDRYFWPRPSAVDYAPLPSSGSNFGPTSDTLARLVEIRRKAFIAGNYLPAGTSVPTEMLFASGSGADPHISPEAALLQIDRIAKARHFDQERKNSLQALVQQHIEKRQFMFLGEPRVNVLTLNIALDEIK